MHLTEKFFAESGESCSDKRTFGIEKVVLVELEQTGSKNQNFSQSTQTKANTLQISDYPTFQKGCHMHFKTLTIILKKHR